jgi:cell division ATPase FtsA
MITPIIHARVEEILCLINNKLQNSGFGELLHNGNLFITGGMSNLEGIYKLSERIFSTLEIKQDKTKIINNSHIDTSSSDLSVCIGLVLYQLDSSITIQLGSNGRLIDTLHNYSASNQTSFGHQNINNLNNIQNKYKNNNDNNHQNVDMGLENIQDNFENNQKPKFNLLKKIGDWL